MLDDLLLDDTLTELVLVDTVDEVLLRDEVADALHRQAFDCGCAVLAHVDYVLHSKHLEFAKNHDSTHSEVLFYFI